MNELVSILVPVYNRAGLVEATLRSALAQIYTPFEVVAVDNASDDGSWDVLQRLAREDSRLRVFRNERNLGPVRNWLACLERAQGALAKILWSDDLIDPDYLRETVPQLGPDIAFVYTAAQVFEDGATPAAPQVLFAGPGGGAHASARYIEGALFGGDVPLSPGCALFRTADLRRNLLLQVPNRVGSDFSMHAIGNDLLAFLLTSREYPRFAVVERPLSRFRAHPGSITSNSSASRLLLHYDIARAHFVETTPLPERLVQRFDACLWLRLRRHDGTPFGLHRTADFYLHRRPAVRPGAIFAETARRLGASLRSR